MTALATLGVIGVLSVIPGVLGRASDHLPALPDEEYQDILRREIEAYEGFLANPACEALPTNLPADPARLPRIVPQEQAGPAPEDAPIQPAIQPDRAPLPDASGDEDALETLQDLIDRSTVLVISQTRDGNRLSTGIGTGFFVTPTDIVTNLHVVEEALGNTPIYIGSRTLGRLHEVEVVATSQSSEFRSRDLALLRLPEPIGASTLSFATNPKRLQNVFAAGYPGAVVETDPRFEALQQDLRAALSGADFPPNVSTQGRVMAIQPGNGDMEIILHRATISPGNSGGPLVDQCGRLVGVNTFLRGLEGGGDTIFYALGPDDTATFLAENGVEAARSEGLCVVGAAPGTDAPSDAEVTE